MTLISILFWSNKQPKMALSLAIKWWVWWKKKCVCGGGVTHQSRYNHHSQHSCLICVTKHEVPLGPCVVYFIPWETNTWNRVWGRRRINKIAPWIFFLQPHQEVIKPALWEALPIVNFDFKLIIFHLIFLFCNYWLLFKLKDYTWFDTLLLRVWYILLYMLWLGLGSIYK